MYRPANSGSRTRSVGFANRFARVREPVRLGSRTGFVGLYTLILPRVRRPGPNPLPHRRRATGTPKELSQKNCGRPLCRYGSQNELELASRSLRDTRGFQGDEQDEADAEAWKPSCGCLGGFLLTPLHCSFRTETECSRCQTRFRTPCCGGWVPYPTPLPYPEERRLANKGEA